MRASLAPARRCPVHGLGRVTRDGVCLTCANVARQWREKRDLAADAGGADPDEDFSLDGMWPLSECSD